MDRQSAGAAAAPHDPPEWGYTMSFLDRILGKGTTPPAEPPVTPTAGPPTTASAPTATLERPTTRQEAEEQLIEIAHRVVPPTDTPTHFFICSGNRSVIEAYRDLFRVGAPAYGGSSGMYVGTAEMLSSRKADAAGQALGFDGKRSMGSTGESVAGVADVLGTLGFEATRGGVYVAYVTVGPTGVEWVREVYTTVMGEAMLQGILPFHMFETGNADAARYLVESFTAA